MKIAIDIQDDEIVVAVGGEVHRCTEAHFAFDHTGPSMTLTHPLSQRGARKAAGEDAPQGEGFGYMDGSR